MRRVVAASILFSLIVAPSLLCAATIEGAVVYTPSTYGPGETVTAVAALKPGPEESLAEISLEPGSGLPALDGSADPEILGLDVERRGGSWLMRLRFVAWSPSEGVIEKYHTGTFVLPPVAYRARPRLGAEDVDPRPLRPQRLPPGAAGAFYGVLGLVVGLCLALFGAFLYLVPAVRSVLARWKAGLAYRRLESTVTHLFANAASAEPAAYAAALAGALRNYLELRACSGISALTPAEVRNLADTAALKPSIRDEAAAVLAWSDEVRFGGLAAKAADLCTAAERVRRIAVENEEAIRARL